MSRCGRGMQTEVALEQRLGEHVCVLQWTKLTTCDVSASPGALICQIRSRKIIFFVDNGPKVHVRCGGWRRKICAKIQNKKKNGNP